jgi:hypothetical protein
VERLRSWSFINDPHKIGLGQGIGNADFGLFRFGILDFRFRVETAKDGSGIENY